MARSITNIRGLKVTDRRSAVEIDDLIADMRAVRESEFESALKADFPVGFALQRSLSKISGMLLTSGVMCDESSTEKPSVMDATYRGGKVVFRCFHTPFHEFEVDV